MLGSGFIFLIWFLNSLTRTIICIYQPLLCLGEAALGLLPPNRPKAFKNLIAYLNAANIYVRF
jgi:hypothetical protein